MAQKVQTTVVCDLHDDEVEGSSVTFAVGGRNYELDLCDEHKAEFDDSLATYVGAARSTASRNGKNGTSKSRSRSNGSRSKGDRKDVREWARANGHDIGERGRIPAEVMDAYEAAH